MISGKVLRFDDVRGYGFIAPDDGGDDVFMHANDLRDEKFLFTPGTAVEFDVVEGDRGLKASAVKVVDRGQSRANASQDDEVMCDVLSPRELMQELTEALLEAAPTLTAAQIVQVRQRIAKLAHAHGWLES
ncbi:cold-shock protein [Kibdelosporangium phytohabitans]|uniref:DNA-binding protein n=1 Tax=Kibdelosporangium phytohabitans TaxID=860235 RepID=A0A0N9I448_9PSEU|nr:cold shock domain-containing protein [Kibdelosporangium phytohabitans]ALG09110.1 DNA-binding protein [Kibdelosporangium phytohabitans]MBE1469689.1 cold shock CspA family protein [Kibdelosporangium phytohabitans]